MIQIVDCQSTVMKHFFRPQTKQLKEHAQNDKTLANNTDLKYLAEMQKLFIFC